jgi:glutamate-5-semialdehyde dehydrogenase
VTIKDYVKQLGINAKQASTIIANLDTKKKNEALLKIAENLDLNREDLIKANQLDLEQAKHNNISEALQDRLVLSNPQINTMIEGLKQVAGLADPIGQITNMNYRPSGIQVGKMRVALGVIGIIYESRPNVTIEAASLCLKSGNACILRGGSEALFSNQTIAKYIHQSLEEVGLPKEIIQVVNTSDREVVGELITLSDYVDVIVPRGGKGLIERVSKHATINVIKHLDGICHVYIDGDADISKAYDVALNSKTQRYGTCNTMETLLVSEKIAKKVLPALIQGYLDKGVVLKGCEKSRVFHEKIEEASEEDWKTEYLAPVLSIRIVHDMNQAIEHINHYSSKHTDSIVTENFSLARRFIREVDSSSVMINASTRFADGFEYGLGAEIGISTDKIHARGPVGLDGLTSEKYVVFGDGHIRG